MATVRVFVAGGSGAIGRRLLPQLVADGHVVTATTRSESKTDALLALGATPVVVDVFDAPALQRIVATARPEVVIHQLTDLPQQDDPEKVAAARAGNARLRSIGTLHLVTAARAAGVRRIVAQSIAWIYAGGPEPHREEDALELGGAGNAGVTARGVADLERLVTTTAGFDGVVLRYGSFYGPGTWDAEPPDAIAVHVDAAARAAVLATTRGTAGIYNIVDDNAVVSNTKARAQLGWDPAFRM